jgi:hypothetical protein
MKEKSEVEDIEKNVERKMLKHFDEKVEKNIDETFPKNVESNILFEQMFIQLFPRNNVGSTFWLKNVTTFNVETFCNIHSHEVGWWEYKKHTFR